MVTRGALDPLRELEGLKNCPELIELDAHLKHRHSTFNAFRVLGLTRNEIRHSTMLAWLLKTDKGFLRTWLKRLASTDTANGLASAETEPRSRWPTTQEIEGLDIAFVDTQTEKGNTDVLVDIYTRSGAPQPQWVVCIENKVDAKLAQHQLLKYRRYVERRNKDAERRLFVLLTKDMKNIAEFDHDVYVPCRYDVVAAALKSALEDGKSSAVDGGDGRETGPTFLAHQYLQLLEEHFLEDEKATQLARAIYKAHPDAIEFIRNVVADPVAQVALAVEQGLVSRKNELGIYMRRCDRGNVRFVPQAWSVETNRGGSDAWGLHGPFVVCQIVLRTVKLGIDAKLEIKVGKAPEPHRARIRERAAREPFKVQAGEDYFQIFATPTTILSGADSDSVAWATKQILSDEFLEAVQAVGEILQAIGPTAE